MAFLNRSFLNRESSVNGMPNADPKDIAQPLDMTTQNSIPKQQTAPELQTTADPFLPMNLFGTDISQLVPTNTSMSGGGSSSYNESQAGINWDTDFMKGLTPELEASYQNLPQNIDDWMNAAQQGYQSDTQRMLNQYLPQQIEQLSARGILDSSMAEGALSNLASDLAQSGAQQGYQTAAEAAKLKTNIPALLAQLAQLGQESTSTGTSQSSQSSQSTQTNPLAPYELMANWEAFESTGIY